MSILIMSNVWQNAPHSGGELLTLLAIADFADDNGVAWPSVLTLATKTRLSTRQVNRCVVSLKSTGWLTIYQIGGGRFKSNCYKINDPPNIPLLAPEAIPINSDILSGFPEGSGNEETLTFETETLTFETLNPDMGVRGNKVMNHQEPLKEPSAVDSSRNSSTPNHENLFHVRLAKAYSEHIGKPSKIITDRISKFLEKYRASHNGNDPPIQWADRVVSEAVTHNVRKWTYIEAILVKWSKDGVENGGSGEPGGDSTDKTGAPKPGGNGSTGKQNSERNAQSETQVGRQGRALDSDGGYRGLFDKFSGDTSEDPA